MFFAYCKKRKIGVSLVYNDIRPLGGSDSLTRARAMSDARVALVRGDNQPRIWAEAFLVSTFSMIFVQMPLSSKMKVRRIVPNDTLP